MILFRNLLTIKFRAIIFIVLAITLIPNTGFPNNESQKEVPSAQMEGYFDNPEETCRGIGGWTFLGTSGSILIWDLSKILTDPNHHSIPFEAIILAGLVVAYPSEKICLGINSLFASVSLNQNFYSYSKYAKTRSAHKLTLSLISLRF